jgi:hypothetical protein
LPLDTLTLRSSIQMARPSSSHSIISCCRSSYAVLSTTDRVPRPAGVSRPSPGTSTVEAHLPKTSNRRSEQPGTMKDSRNTWHPCQWAVRVSASITGTLLAKPLRLTGLAPWCANDL